MCHNAIAQIVLQNAIATHAEGDGARLYPRVTLSELKCVCMHMYSYRHLSYKCVYVWYIHMYTYHNSTREYLFQNYTL